MSATPSRSEIEGDPIASIAQRIGARVIDWLLLLAISLLIGLVSASGDPDVPPPTWAVLASIIVVFGYEALLVATRGQTVGKAVLGIEIVRLSDGRRPPFLAAALRVVPIIVLLVLLQQFSYIAMVFVYFSAAFMPHSRGVLDLLAGTVVIVARR